MSTTYINAELRRLVTARSGYICEYCLIAEDDTFFGCAVDHIISERHSGPTERGNLAFACVFCNQAKGSDIGPINWDSKTFVRFFNPRTDRWSEHFTLSGARIEPLTPIGSVTARILGFNTVERILERQTLMDEERYPSAAVATCSRPGTRTWYCPIRSRARRWN
jgi:hypothetical protein